MNPSTLYRSTRGGEEGKSFEEVLLSAYAVDGGLYVPHALPFIGYTQLCNWRSLALSEICAEVIHLFTDIEIESLREMTSRAFSTFNSGVSPPLPMTKVGNLIFLDTSLGPTLSFKDIGQQVVAQLLNFVLGKQSKKAKILIETSGDTGPAAIAGVKGCSNIEIYCLYPYQRVSDIQELQMITVLEPNVHVYRTEGDSDEQASVLKEMFRDVEFMKRNNICSINSINWARVMTQSSYYIWSYLQVYNTPEEIGKPVIFCVPTGAFGNAIGGLLAQRMGVPIQRIVCATNENDIVHRTLSRGDLSMGENKQTVSPAMDIQFAYNLERLLYYMGNENTALVREVMQQVELQFSYSPGATGARLDPFLVRRIQETFSSQSVSDLETLQTISSYCPTEGDGGEGGKYLLCPHSATAVYVASSALARTEGGGEAPSATGEALCIPSGVPVICVLTAHPAKFEEAILKATGKEGGGRGPLPAVQALKEQPTKFQWLRKERGTDPESAGDSGREVEGVNWRRDWIEKLTNDIEN